MKRTWVKIVIVCLASCLLLKGAATGGQPQADRKITFAVFGEPGGDWGDIYFSVDAQTFEPLRFNPYGRSGQFTAVVGQEIHFYRKVESSESTGEADYELIRTVGLSAEVTDFLFLFVSQPIRSDRGESQPVAVFAFDDGRRAMPPDGLVFFNATGLPLQGSINRLPTRLNPGQSPAIKIDPGTEVALEFSVLHEGVLRPVLINQLRISPSRRTLLLLLPPRMPGSLRIRAFRISDTASEGSGN